MIPLFFLIFFLSLPTCIKTSDQLLTEEFDSAIIQSNESSHRGTPLNGSPVKRFIFEPIDPILEELAEVPTVSQEKSPKDIVKELLRARYDEELKIVATRQGLRNLKASGIDETDSLYQSWVDQIKDALNNIACLDIEINIENIKERKNTRSLKHSV